MEPTFMTFMESKTYTSMFLDSEIRILKKYCNDNDGVIRFHFVGDTQVASMQFGPSLYDRVEITRKNNGYAMVLKSEDIDVGIERLSFTSFKEVMRYLEEET